MSYMNQNRMQSGMRAYPQGVNANNGYGNDNRNSHNNSCGCKQAMSVSGAGRMGNTYGYAQNGSERHANNACSDTSAYCKAFNGKSSLEPVDKMGPTMGYIPWQRWEEIYDVDKGLYQGTIFCNLDKPFKGGCL